MSKESLLQKTEIRTKLVTFYCTFCSSFYRIIYKYHCMFFQVIPPGMDFSKVIQEANEPDGDLALTNAEGSSPKAVPPIWSEVSMHNYKIMNMITFIYFRCIYSSSKTFVAGYAVFDKSTQTDDIGFVKTRSKEKHYYSFEGFWRMSLFKRACEPCN